MASISITIGSITATRNATNATAQAIITDFIAANGGPINGTPQEQADWFLTQWIQMVRESANNYKRRSVAQAAIDTSGVNTRDWV